jgi:pimeloyl-ACP methyl ester carboxylesterase
MRRGIRLVPDGMESALAAIEAGAAARRTPPLPFVRQAGSGPGVVCLHANASSSGQWRPLMQLLAPRWRVLAADSYGAGRTPAWPGHRTIRLRDEAALLEPVFRSAGAPFVLVGHSYGAAVALVAAAARPDRVRALALYEPTLFALLDRVSPPPNDSDGIRFAVADAAAAVAAGDPDAAAECFVDFWSGSGAWAGTPEARRAAIRAAIVNVGAWGEALFGEPTPLAAFAGLQVPVLLMSGTRSPASGRGVGRLLTRVLPRAEVVELPGLGHMGPVTHPDVVNRAIARFLDRR